MANPEHLKILNQGVEAWNEWREENPEARPDLTKADLTGADLIRADLRWMNLLGADLNMAELTASMLFETIFGDTVLKGCIGLDECLISGPCTIDFRTF